MAITVLMRCLEDIERRAAHNMMFSEQVQGSVICTEYCCFIYTAMNKFDLLVVTRLNLVQR